MFKLGRGVDHMTRDVWPPSEVKMSKFKVTVSISTGSILVTAASASVKPERRRKRE